MKGLTSIILTIVIATCIVIPMDAAQCKDRGMHKHKNPILDGNWERILDIAEEIKLTDTQLEQLQELRSSSREVINPIQSQMKTLRENFRDQMIPGQSPDQKTIFGMIDAITKLENKLMKENFKSKLAFEKILTTEQREALKDLRSERKENRREKRSQHRQKRQHRNSPDQE